MEIFNQIKCLGASRNFVYYTLKRYRETSSLDDRPKSGHPRTVRTPANIKLIRERLRRNPCRTQKKMALQANISRISVNRILKYDLKVKAYSRRKVHYLNERLRKLRPERCRQLLKRHDPKRILFLLRRNLRQKKSSTDRTTNFMLKVRERSQLLGAISSVHNHPASVCGGCFQRRGLSAPFLPKRVQNEGTKLSKRHLETVVKPLSTTLFDNKDWIFQQGSAPSHKAKSTQKWLMDNLPGLISAEEQPSWSPDLYPLDYSFWVELELKECRKSHPNLASLKRALTRGAKRIPLKKIRAAIDEWPTRLRACIKNKGGHFE